MYTHVTADGITYLRFDRTEREAVKTFNEMLRIGEPTIVGSLLDTKVG